ncbi:AI-2E family transporter [Paenibacillus chitinolyticus]|uniref:AI-2E family transporter n=1 Tax=Paenibacillus chitinolyticus TaxID=79263 RepID=A0A410X2S5_9BACL|nr:AI-2E family transporter [Paenibacillus chitinolyticus]MCY9593826.1 AI-2E family transporter [Paenibacillus chitinolyticus]MCY9599331.1 AI-2E family transporter [Paenibacillus chitinolyticus]QAV20909.1 AI-2E family transporter [Paenibacillus chitinolyticus]
MFTKQYFQSKGFRRILIFALLALILYAMQSMINLILLTFIFAFLMDRMQSSVSSRLNRYMRVDRRWIVAILYVVILALLGIGMYRYLPVVAVQVSQVVRQLYEFYTQPQDNEVLSYIINLIKPYIEQTELSKYMNQGFGFVFKSVTDISKVLVQVFIALLLSLFFLLEKPRIIRFTAKFKDSKIAAFYEEVAYFGSRFVHSFGKVLEAQFLIALVNGILSVIALWILGFPQLFGLGLMIFLLGLVPVAGVIISLIPLCTIAYSIDGIMMVVYVLVLVAILHALEAYMLNPKLMSAKTNLPVFYTFIVLIFSEHFMGVWGLIIGIPIFMFLLDVLDVTREKEPAA